MIFGSPEGKSPGRTTWAFWLRENGKVSLTAIFIEFPGAQKALIYKPFMQ
jgi:hypothetical protein